MFEPTEQEIEDAKSRIDNMSRISMARLRRFAPVGHMFFRMDLSLSDYFEKRFAELGGMSPEISKSIGWQK